MGPSVPRGPSEAQIKTESELETERVRFEGERRQFIERVGAYETIARNNLSGERGSFDTTDWTPMDSTGLYIPQKFDPSFNPNQMKYVGQDLSWFSAPNLGIGLNAQQQLADPLASTKVPYIPAPTQRSDPNRDLRRRFRGIA
jgi:hypothetical protein